MKWTEEQKQKIRFGITLVLMILCLYWLLGSLWLVFRSLRGGGWMFEYQLNAMGTLSAILCVLLVVSLQFGAGWAAAVPLAGAVLCGIFSLLQWKKRPVPYCQFTLVLSVITIVAAGISGWLSLLL